MSSRSLIGGNLNLNSLAVKYLTVTDSSNNATEFGNIECIGIEATDKVKCPVFECPTSDYDSTNISEPKCSNGITIGTRDSNGLNYEANLQINSWNSSGFVDTDSKKCNLTINHRSGDLQTRGDISGHTGTFDTINVSTLNVLSLVGSMMDRTAKIAQSLKCSSWSIMFGFNKEVTSMALQREMKQGLHR